MSLAPPPGWWQASDFRWYPPHLHPDYPPTAARRNHAHAPSVPSGWFNRKLSKEGARRLLWADSALTVMIVVMLAVASGR